LHFNRDVPFAAMLHPEPIRVPGVVLILFGLVVGIFHYNPVAELSAVVLADVQ
jgi:hypothetical protein